MRTEIRPLNFNRLQMLSDKQPKTDYNTGKSISFGQKADEFEKELNALNDKSNNNKFDLSECGKNFLKGILSPLTAIVKHPVATVATVAATVAACTLVPVLGPVMAIGFGALSAYQLGKGIVNVAKNIKNKDYDQAEKSFNEVGQGTVGVAMSALGIKQTAKVAKEAKLMSELGTNSLETAQKAEIANEIKNMSYMDSMKETGKLFTTKDGLKSIVSQFKPSNIRLRGKEAFNHCFKKEEVTKIKKEKMAFKDTTEGKRREAMTTEEIEAEVNSLYKEAFDEYGIPDELRPEIEVYSDTANPQAGGAYTSAEHKISINSESYKTGHFDLPDVIKHESNHANEAILKQRLPQEEKEQMIAEYYLDKIQNGDKPNVVTGDVNKITGAKTIEPPKMNAKMKADFSKLAKEKLYKLYEGDINPTSDEEFISMVKPLVESNPEFSSQYSSVDDATNALAKYAKSHNNRYNMEVKYNTGFNTSKIDPSLLKELTPEEKVQAIEAFKQKIGVYESNVAKEGGSFGYGDFDQYQFTPEEVMCQQKGNNFEISKLNKQLETLRSQKKYDLAEEARLLEEIKKSELTIEYKTKGQEMYKLATESYNHPENIELKNQVKVMEKELSNLDTEIKGIRGDLSYDDIWELKSLGKTPDEIQYIAKNNPSNEYSTYTVLERPEMGASPAYPFATTDAVEIIEKI